VKRLLVPFVAIVVLVACAPVFALFDTPVDDASASPETTTDQQYTDIAVAPPATLIAAGDIADCDSDGDEATAKLLEKLVKQNKDAVIALLGDNVYPSGTLKRYQDCYAPSWGKFLDRTRSAQGNHDFAGGTGDGYYAYFGEAAGPKNKGYYSYTLGTWHIVVINSNCWAVGGCGAGSPQLNWLKQDLKSNPAKCTLAYWHHPRFSSGLHGSTEEMAAIWDVLSDAGAELVLSGHDHHYERFVPMDKSGKPSETGVRQFVVGTGGKSHYPALGAKPGSQVRNSSTYGVLNLTLTSSSYAWRFVPIEGSSFTDAGSTQCH
jgi:hypothetical protein